MAELKISGLKTCDSTRRALKALAEAGISHHFRDFRTDPPGKDEILALWQAVGPALLNRASTTWRSLGEDERALDPVALLTAHPALIKRPVIEGRGRITSGWRPEQQKAWLG